MSETFARSDRCNFVDRQKTGCKRRDDVSGRVPAKIGRDRISPDRESDADRGGFRRGRESPLFLSESVCHLNETLKKSRASPFRRTAFERLLNLASDHRNGRQKSQRLFDHPIEIIHLPDVVDRARAFVVVA